MTSKSAGSAKAPKLRQVIRLDSLPLGQTFFTPEGYLIDRPILTSTGIFEYTNPDGSVRRELRLPEDVFDPESLASYKGKPVIITHDAGLIDKKNVGREGIGTILTEGYRDGDDVRAEIVIQDTDEMRHSKLKELSLGYNLDCEETPGVWNGQPYDAIQRNIRINHLALVREARAGEQARLNIDGRDSEITLKGGKVMKKKATHKKARRNDGVLSPEELQKAIAEYKASRKKGAASDGEEETKEVVTNPAASADDDDTVIAPAGQEKMDDEVIEEEVGAIKERNTDADADMQKLFDIIDTLLAQKDFDEADPEEPVQEDEDDEPIPSTAEDEDDEEPIQEDEDEEEVAEDEDDEELTEDEDDEEFTEDCGAKCDDDDDPIPSSDEGDVAPGEVLNADSIDYIVRERVKLGTIGKALNMDGLENMKLMKAKKAVIKAVRPGMRLDGKSRAYINAAFDAAVEDVKAKSRKDTKYQKRQMFNKDSRTAAKKDNGISGADKARERMIARQQKTK